MKITTHTVTPLVYRKALDYSIIRCLFYFNHYQTSFLLLTYSGTHNSSSTVYMCHYEGLMLGGGLPVSVLLNCCNMYLHVVPVYTCAVNQGVYVH